MRTNILSLLRFMAAIVVILFHLKGKFEYLNSLPGILLAGPQMCTFFIVLSGFVLGMTYNNEYCIKTSTFITRRLHKIYPIYFVSLVFCVPVLWLQDKFDFYVLLLNLGLLQSWIPPYPLSVNGPAWFLSVLFFCYITFPKLLKYLSTKSNKSGLLYWSLFLWVITQVVHAIILNSHIYTGTSSITHDLIYYFPVSHYCSFLLGVSGYIWIKENKTAIHEYLNTYLFLFLSLVLIIITIQNQDHITHVINFELPFGASFYAPFFLLLIMSVFLLSDIKVNNTLTKSLSYLGDLSLPIYILQSPVAEFTFFVLTKSQTDISLQLPLYFICLFIASVIVTRFLEMLTIKYMNKNEIF
jgi:peptidoglycan/LPS O-acetylase OafA/YrhL